MISVYVDEAAAFDMLAILHLKKDKANGFANYEDFYDDLVDVLGIVQVEEILESAEYNNLLLANNYVFNLIDEIVNHDEYSMSAITVHEANMKRFYAKKALQSRFFGDELTEQKTIK